jgi:hypothetical protein
VARITPDHVRAMGGAGRLVEGGVELVTGLAASPGTAAGRAHTDVDAALAAAEAGEPVSDTALRTLLVWAVEASGGDDLPPDHVLAPLSGTVAH